MTIFDLNTLPAPSDFELEALDRHNGRMTPSPNTAMPWPSMARPAICSVRM